MTIALLLRYNGDKTKFCQNLFQIIVVEISIQFNLFWEKRFVRLELCKNFLKLLETTFFRHISCELAETVWRRYKADGVDLNKIPSLEKQRPFVRNLNIERTGKVPGG